MTVAIMQPYLFPYIGYWQLINLVDIFVIYDDVNYHKKGYINKNNILISGQAQSFTLELLQASQNKYINEIKVGHNSKKILKTITMAYKKAPYFKKIYPLLEKILNNEEKNLAKYIGDSIMEISKYLKINTKFIYSSCIKKNNNLKAQNKIIDINKNLKSTFYINAIGGLELYDKAIFLKENIKISFLSTVINEYTQFNNAFIPNLSIIDILMFNSIDDIIMMMDDFKLVGKV